MADGAGEPCDFAVAGHWREGMKGREKVTERGRLAEGALEEVAGPWR
jgi:hypothetical protein